MGSAPGARPANGSAEEDRPGWKDFVGSAPFVLPMLAFVLVFILAPVIGTAYSSFFHEVTFLPRRFAGIDNYLQLVRDPAFWQSARFSFLFILASVPLELFFGMIFALILTQPMPWRGLWRACVLIPWAIPAAISARIWELVYNYHYGLANYVVTSLGITSGPVNWLGTDLGAFVAVVLTDAWKTTPFVAIILMAGLSAIPEDLNRQAQVDGAHFLQRFFRITLPMLKPVVVVVLLFRTIDALRVFDVIYVLTQGGPGGSTTSFSLYGYRLFLVGDFGMGSAVSVVLFLIALAFSLLYVRAGRFQEGLK